MKHLATLLLAALMCAGAHAQTFFADGGTQSSTNVAYAVVPTGSSVKYVLGRGEIAPRLEIWKTTASALVSTALAAGLTNVLTSSTNGFFTGDTVLIYDVSGNAYQRAKIMAPLAAGFIITNDLAAVTTSFALVPGDVVYRLASTVSVPLVAHTTTTWSSSGNGNVWIATGGPSLVQVRDLGTPTTNQVVVVTGER